MVHNIDAAAFQRMVIHGAAAISAQKQPINDLNVFPVPDGDTGTNMSLTIGAAAAEMKKNRYQAVGQAAQGTASALLRGGPGQLRRHPVSVVPRLCQGDQGEGNHGRPGSGYRSGFRRGRRL